MHRIDVVQRQPAGGFGEEAAIIAVPAGDGFVADGVPAEFAQSIQNQPCHMGFSGTGIGSRYKEAHAQEVGFPVAAVKTGK